jgi:hypothetical protein
MYTNVTGVDMNGFPGILEKRIHHCHALNAKLDSGMGTRLQKNDNC